VGSFPQYLDQEEEGSFMPSKPLLFERAV